MKINHQIGYALLFFSVLLSCNNNKTASFSDPLVTNRDTTVSPAVDFFNYANGGWFKNNPIKSTEKSNGIFRTIQDTINNQVKSICELSAKANAEFGSNKQKIGDFYASGMDSVTINKNGFSPLQKQLAVIDEVTNADGLIKTVAFLHTIGANPMWNFYVSQDDKISSKHAVFLQQGGLGLGEREYYFNTDAETKKIRAEYVLHIKAIFNLLGSNANDAQTNATKIMQIETELAKNSRKMEALRDPIKNYNKMSIAKLNAITPVINWNAAFANFGLSKVDSVIVGQPEFFKGLDAMLKSYPIADWKTYLKWNLINNYASFLSDDFENQNFKFYSTTLTGIKKQKPRWKRVVQQTDGSLGELIGQVYVEEYLPKGAKAKLLEIGTNIRDVYAEHIKKLDWMSAPTKVKALQKLSKIVMKVGYPDKWKDLSSVTISKTNYCQNVVEVNTFFYRFMINKFGKAVDRNEWNMQPQTYNAYYNPSNNEIVVPACNIIVPGFEGQMPDDALLYGIIGGSTFGHEITHGFDDQGSQYDDKGNLKNWWTADDLKKFKQKTGLIVSQFNKFKVGSKNVNGENTQGENIADLGGVVIGFEAFKKTNQYKKRQIISKLTPEQRYFLAYGYAWMVNNTAEALSQQVMTDVHAPAQFRINGPLANNYDFFKAFNIKEGSPMRQSKKDIVVIW